nr:uncharacterized protein CXorf23 homolog isoform X2 [Monopterus albus]
MYPGGQRRSFPFPDEYLSGHQHHPDQEELYHGRASLHHDMMGFDEQGLSLHHSRRGFQEHFESFENTGGSSPSPPQLVREILPPTPRSHSDHQQREGGVAWRTEEQGRHRGRFRDFSPNVRYRNGENFREQPHSMDKPRDARETLHHEDSWHLPPLVIEHDHGIGDIRQVPWWDQYGDNRGLDTKFDQRPRPLISPPEHFRSSESRLDDREDAQGYHFQDNGRDPKYPESRSSPMLQDRPMRYGNRDGPVSYKGKGGPRPLRGRLSHAQGGRTGPPRNQPRLQQSSQGYQNPPHEEQRPGFRPFREDYRDPIEGDLNWAEEDRLQQWESGRPGSLDRHLPRVDLDPHMLRQREHGWIDRKTNMTVAPEETLTIKVDMSRPVNENSLLCYSSDRQLSLDLVNVGRQRLDFLPMLEHSGTYRETAMHTGTFAQEIITLVHQVKEQYFRDDGVTLNERFSTPPNGGRSEEVMEELTLDERFNSNRGFSLKMKSQLDDDDDEPLFRPGHMQGPSQQPVRAPGDLRHDLERRRQERLEGVKVTIPGSSMSLHPLSEMDTEYRDKDEMEEGGFSNLPEDQSKRREANMGPRRGASYRQNTGPQRRNNRSGNRPGQMRRQNNRSNPAGPSW